MTDDTRDPFGSIPIAGDGEEGKGEEPQPLPAAPKKQPPPRVEKPAPSVPPPPRRFRRQRPKRSHGPWRRRLTRLGTVAAAGFALYLLAGYLLMPYLLGSVLPGRLAGALDRPVTVGAASFNPFTLTVTFQDGIIGPRLTDAAEGIDPLLSFDRLRLDLAVASLFKRALICNEVTADRLVVHLVRHRNGTYNLQALLPPAGGGFRFSLNNIRVRDSRLLFNDRPTGATHRVEKIELDLPSLANIDYRPQKLLSPRFAAEVDGSPLLLTGTTRTTPAGSESRLTLHLKQLDLPRYFAYLPVKANFTISKGQADLDLNLLIQTGKQSHTQLQIQGTGRLTHVWLQSAGAGKELVRLPAATGIVSFAPLRGRYRLKKLVLQKPEFFLERDAHGRWLLPRLAAAPGSRVEIDRLLVTHGRLSVVDRQVKGGFTDTWTDLFLSIKDLINDSGKQATFALSGRSGKTRLSAQGRLYRKPLRAQGIFVGRGLQLADFNPYLEEARGLRIRQGAATPKIKAQFTASRGKNGLELSLTKMNARINNLALAHQQEEWLRLPEVEVKDAALDWPGRQMVLGNLEAAGGALRLDWDQQGRLNWKQAETKTDGWQVAVKSAALKGMALRLRTEALAAPLTLTIQKTAITLTDLTTRRGSQGHLQLAGRLFGESPVEFSGSLETAPFDAQLTAQVKGLSLLHLQPLFHGWFRPNIRKGTLQAHGKLHLPAGIFQGSASINGLVATLDNTEVLRCQQAASPKLTIDFRSGTISASAATIDQPFATWALADKDGASLNELWHLSWATAAGKPRLALDQVEIHRGALAFSDLAASPPYAATIAAVSGSIAPFTSTAGARSQFALTGRIDQAGLSAQGTTQPFADQPTAEIKGDVQDFPLIALSPYLKKQLGYRLAGGTLDLAASVHLAKGHLQATNHLQATGLALGQPVDSTIPLTLTVALLTDRNNHIELDIPVAGETADPDFSYRDDLRGALRNLLLRTAVSPFSLLAAVSPNGGLEHYLAFLPGRAELNPADKKQLQILARVMTERPRLKLVLRGFAGDQDRQALKAKKKAEKKERQQAQEAQQASKLTAAYGREETRLAATPAAPAAPPPPPRPIKISRAMLLKLAGSRGRNSQHYLIGLGLPAARVGLASAGGPAAADVPGRPGNRVEIGLEALQP